MSTLTVMKANIIVGATGSLTQSWFEKQRGVAVIRRGTARVEITQEQVNALAAQYDVREATKQEEAKREIAATQRANTQKINTALNKMFK